MTHADAEFYHAIAHGQPGLHPLIADKPVTVTADGHGHVTVTDDRHAHHDFQGARWSQIKRSMLDYFDAVEDGE